MRSLSRSTIGFALVAASTVIASHAGAQATVNATASVASAIVVTPRDLQFGTLFPSFAKTVVFIDNTPGTKQSGRFDVAAEAGSTVSYAFSAAPSVLTHTTLAGVTMPLSLQFCSNTVAAGTGCVAAALPSGVTMPAGPVGTQTHHYIFVAGTATPGGAQASGTYSASLTLTVAYTGS